MDRNEVFNIFFREKPAKMIVALHAAKSDLYASSLAKQVDCTQSHFVKILQQMEEAGLLTFDKQGRLKLLALTKKGEEVAEYIQKIKTLL